LVAFSRLFRQWRNFLSLYPRIIPWLHGFSHVSMTGCNLCTLFISYEWMINFKSRVVSHKTKQSFHKAIIKPLFVLVFALLFNVTKFLEYGDDSNPPEFQTELRMNDLYIITYITVISPVLNSYIPFIIMLLINFKIYSEVKRYKALQRIVQSNLTSGKLQVLSREFLATFNIILFEILARKRLSEKKMTMMLFSIIFMFILCNIPKNIVNIYDGIIAFQEFSRKEKSTKFPHWISFLINFSHILLILNSSVNIFIYLLKDSKFRKECVSSLKRHTLINNTRRGQNKRNPAMSTLTNKNLSVDTFFKFSKSDSLDSTYSRATSIFGFSSSRQSSQVIPFKFNILWNFLFPGTGHRS